MLTLVARKIVSQPGLAWPQPTPTELTLYHVVPWPLDSMHVPPSFSFPPTSPPVTLLLAFSIMFFHLEHTSLLCPTHRPHLLCNPFCLVHFYSFFKSWLKHYFIKGNFLALPSEIKSRYLFHMFLRHH